MKLKNSRYGIFISNILDLYSSILCFFALSSHISMFETLLSIDLSKYYV